jgi:mutator protein MutT
LSPVDHIIVAAAVVERDGTFLVTRRLPGTHLEGLWEFPGGKCEAGESPRECLRREIREELGVDVEVGREILTTDYEYSTRTIRLHFYECLLQGTPAPQHGQLMRWVTRDELRTLEFPAADRHLIDQLSYNTSSQT